MNAWVLEKHRPLADLFRARGVLGEEEYALLQALVERQLARHGGDAEKSLAALSSVSSHKPVFDQVRDADVQASLMHVGLGTVESTSPERPPATERYHILRPHARGGLGEVFVAED